MTNPLFFYNGIKDEKGAKLQKCHYSIANSYKGAADGSIIVYADWRSSRFSAKVQAAFMVKNDSDSCTDYFDTDRFVIEKDHPLFPAVLEAFNKAKAHDEKRIAKRQAKRAA